MKLLVKLQQNEMRKEFQFTRKRHSLNKGFSTMWKMKTCDINTIQSTPEKDQEENY